MDLHKYVQMGKYKASIGYIDFLPMMRNKNKTCEESIFI